MPLTHIPQEELNAEWSQFKRSGATSAPKTEMRGGDGIVTMRIPQKIYLNASVVHGHTLTDTEYWNDQCRMFPEIKVKYQSRKTGISLRKDVTREFTPAHLSESKLTRFGRVTYHKRYA